MADNDSDQRNFEIDGIRATLATAPPVYAPGGPVALVFNLPEATTASLLDGVEKEATRRGAVLMIVQCSVEAGSQEELLRAQGYTFASSWYLRSPLSATSLEQNDIVIRTATASDVPRILEIGERKRAQYERFSPVFWKKAPTPRQEFAPYMTGQVESAENIALVAEIAGEMRGYLIAQCRNRAEGYIDDYAVADPEADWPDVGVALLSAVEPLASDREVASLMMVTAHADAAQRAVAEQRGFILRKHWLVKPLASPV